MLKPPALAVLMTAWMIWNCEVLRMDWEKAIEHLNMLISEYELLGLVGYFGLRIVLYPLRARVEAGERSEELYNQIMECE